MRMLCHLSFLLLALTVLQPQDVLSQGEQGELYGGDIMLTPEQEMSREATSNTNDPNAPQNAVVRNSRSIWPNGRVPYIFDSSISTQARTAIMDAIEAYARQTCIRLEPRQSTDADYVRFFRGAGCFSFIGRIGGPQDISIGQGCEREGIVIHEIFHALGRWHEQSRPDRDMFVTINFDNILSGRESNFEITNPTFATTQSVPYDLSSIMHYGGFDFSRNRLATIVPRDGSDPSSLGQRQALTNFDLQHIVSLYCSDSGSPGSWSSWNTWTSCSRTCNGGLRSRMRECVGGVNCEGSNIQQQRCNTNSCPTPSQWGSWGSYGGCSATCGGGRQQRTRRCMEGNNCVGISNQFRDCNNGSCPQAPTWASWGSWSSCSSTCNGGTHQRTRRCLNGNTCSGSNIQTQTCNSNIPCDNGIGAWSTWSACSVTCGGGRRLRIRQCGSNNCDTQLQTCNTQNCEPTLRSIEYRGCWYLNTRNPSLGLLEGTTPDLSDDPIDRTNPVGKCGIAALQNSFRFFGVTLGYCVSGSNTLSDYQYVRSDLCRGNRGAYNANNGFFIMDVYEVIDQQVFMDSVVAPVTDGSGSGSGSGSSGARVGAVYSMGSILIATFIAFL